MALNAALSWTMLTMALQTILRMGGNIALTHILLPHDFGLAAIVFAVIFGIEMMTDGGAMVSLMRSKRTDDAWLDTVWTFEVCRSLLIATVAVIIAHPVSVIFEEPQLAPMMMFIGLVPVSSALTSTSKYMALRNLSLKRYSIAEVAVLAFSYLISLPVAWYTKSAWALLFGGVAYVALLSLSSFFIFPSRRHRLRFEKAALKEVLGFGLWLTVTSAIAFAIVQGDKFIIGKALGVSALGVYSVAAAWSGALTDVAVRFIMRIFIPVFSAMYREDGHTDRIRRLRINMLLSGMVPVAAFSGLGYPLVHFVYPDSMNGAAPVLGVLVVGVWFAVLDTLYHHQFLAEGKSDRRLYAQVVSLIFLAAALALTWSHLTTFSLTAIFVAGIAVRSSVMASMAYAGNLKAGVPDLALTLVFLALAYFFSYTAQWLSLITSDLGVMLLQMAVMALPAIAIGFFTLKRSNLLMANLIQV
jgi:O-antigen/teichoic acid export membrane protein